jgi:predicted RNase H-like HicB family nuclease
MKYKLLVTIEKVNDNEYMARAEDVRATAMGDSVEDALDSLRESINLMIDEYGSELVFKGIKESLEYRFVEVGN